MTSEEIVKHLNPLGEIVPMPYGKLAAPDISKGYNYNRPTTPADQIILCPECESDHTCFLPSEDVWFCISCRECWKYERET